MLHIPWLNGFFFQSECVQKYVEIGKLENTKKHVFGMEFIHEGLQRTASAKKSFPWR